jgi:hypothetical protein
MPDHYRITILGNARDVRTEAEVYVPPESQDPVALIYESSDGWQVQTFEITAPTNPEALIAALQAACEQLGEYVNRRGENPPAGLAAPGLSLWLMEKRDGTAMGQSIR